MEQQHKLSDGSSHQRQQEAARSSKNRLCQRSQEPHLTSLGVHWLPVSGRTVGSVADPAGYLRPCRVCRFQSLQTFSRILLRTNPQIHTHGRENLTVIPPHPLAFTGLGCKSCVISSRGLTRPLPLFTSTSNESKEDNHN